MSESLCTANPMPPCAPSSTARRRTMTATEALQSSATKPLGAHGLCFVKTAEEIGACLKTLVAGYEARINALAADPLPAAQPPPSALFAATFGRLADADGHAALASAELTLPALVSGDAAVRAASSAAKKELQQMWSRTYARPDVYARLLAAEGAAQTAEERRLIALVLGRFRSAGAAVSDDTARAEVSALDARCAALAFEIEQNINEDCTTVALTDQELEVAFVRDGHVGSCRFCPCTPSPLFLLCMHSCNCVCVCVCVRVRVRLRACVCPR